MLRTIRFLLLTTLIPLFGNTAAAQGNDPALDSYYAANALYNKNLFDLAVDEYRSFIAKYPRHEKILHAKFGLAFALYNLGRFREAEVHLAELSRERDAPKKEQIYNFWGQCLLILGRPAEAEAAFLWSVNRGKERLFLDLPGMGGQFQEAPEMASSSVQDLDPLERALVGLIEALFQQAKWSGVNNYAAEFVELVPESEHVARVRFQSAFARYEMGNFPEAARILEDIKLYHRQSGFYEHAVFLLAECQREMGNLDLAATNHSLVAREVKGEFAGNSLFRLGFIRFSQQNFQQAAKDFEDLRLLYPQSEYFNDAGVFLGRALLESQNYTRAQEIFGSLTTVGPVSSEATLWLARTFLRQNNHQQALDVLSPAIRRFNADTRLNQFVFEYGTALLGLQRYAEAADVFKRVVTDFGEGVLTPQALRLRAFCLLNDKSYVESLTACERFLQAYPNDPSYRDVAFMRAENIFFLDRLDDAVRAYQQFIPWDRRTEYTDEARFRIIQIMAEQQKWSELLDSIYELRREGNPVGVFFEQLDYIEGLTYFNLARWDNAIQSLEKFIRENPKRLNGDIAQIKLAQAYESKRDGAKAKLALEVLVLENPTSQYLPQALAELGRMFYLEGNATQAEVYFNRVSSEFQSSPFFAQAQYYLGWIEMNRDNHIRAVAFFDKVASQFPDDILAIDSQYKKGLLYLEMDQPTNAQTAFRHFLDRYPNDQRFDQASFYNGKSLALMQRYTEALSVLSGLVSRTRDADLAARSLYEMAWCNQGLSNPEAAKARYQDILNNYADHPLAKSAMFELAELEYEAGNYDSAVGRLDSLLAGNLTEHLRERVLNRMGWCLIGRKQELAAAEVFEQMMRDFPTSEFTGVAAYQAGEIRLLRKEYSDALPHFERARQFSKDDRVLQQASLRLGETLGFLNQWTESEKVFSEFYARYPDSEFNRRAVLWLAWSQENLGRYEQAIANYRIVMRGGRRDELSARSQFQIGQCLIAMGEGEQAVRELVLVDVNYAFPVWSARAILEIGRVLDNQKLEREANDRFREVILKFPDTDEASLARDLLRERGVRI
jgi:TolA-binding protein